MKEPTVRISLKSITDIIRRMETTLNLLKMTIKKDVSKDSVKKVDGRSDKSGPYEDSRHERFW